MLKAIEQYKNFKKMYIVDNSAAKYEGKFKGIQYRGNIISGMFFGQIMIPS